MSDRGIRLRAEMRHTAAAAAAEEAAMMAAFIPVTDRYHRMRGCVWRRWYRYRFTSIALIKNYFIFIFILFISHFMSFDECMDDDSTARKMDKSLFLSNNVLTVVQTYSFYSEVILSSLLILFGYIVLCRGLLFAFRCR